MRGFFRMWEARAEVGSGSDASAEATREHTRSVAEGIQLKQDQGASESRGQGAPSCLGACRVRDGRE